MKFLRVVFMALLCAVQGLSSVVSAAEAEYAAEQARQAAEAEDAAEQAKKVGEQEAASKQAEQQKEGWGSYLHRHTVGRVQDVARTVVDTAHAYTVAPVLDAVQRLTGTGTATEGGVQKHVDLSEHVASPIHEPLHSQTHVIIPAFNGPKSGAESFEGQSKESVSEVDEESKKRQKAYVLYEQKLQDVSKEVARYKAEKVEEAKVAAEREVYRGNKPDENPDNRERVRVLWEQKLKDMDKDFERYQDEKVKEAHDAAIFAVYGTVRHDINFVARNVEGAISDADIIARGLEKEAERAAHDIEGGSKATRTSLEVPVPDVPVESVGLFSSVVGIVQNVAGLSRGFVQSVTQLLPSLDLGLVPDTGSFDLSELEDIDKHLAMGGERNVEHFADIEARQRAFDALPKIDAVTLDKLTQTKALLDSWTGTALRPLLSRVIPTMPKMEALLNEMVTTQRVPVDVEAQLQEVIAGVPGGARLAEVSGLVAGSALKGENPAAMLDAAAKVFPQLLPLMNAAHDLGLAREMLSKSTDPVGDLQKLNTATLRSPILKKLVESVNNVMTSKENAQIRTAKITAIVKQVAVILFGIALTSVVLMIASDAKDNKTLRSLTQYCLIFDVVALMGGLAYGFKKIAALTHYEPKTAQGKAGQMPVVEEPVKAEPVVEPAEVV